MRIEEECEKVRQRGLTRLRRAVLARLRAASARNPYDLGILGAIVAMNREAGHPKAALPCARKLARGSA